MERGGAFPSSGGCVCGHKTTTFASGGQISMPNHTTLPSTSHPAAPELARCPPATNDPIQRALFSTIPFGCACITPSLPTPHDLNPWQTQTNNQSVRIVRLDHGSGLPVGFKELAHVVALVFVRFLEPQNLPFLPCKNSWLGNDPGIVSRATHCTRRPTAW